MKKTLLSSALTAFTALVIAGCSTPKIRIPADAQKITYYNSVVSTMKDCMHVGSFNVPKQHPNNFEPYVKREVHKLGGSHYSVHVTSETGNARPLAGEVNAYYCREKPTATAAPVANTAPQQSQPLPFYIINNNNNNNNN